MSLKIDKFFPPCWHSKLTSYIDCHSQIMSPIFCHLKLTSPSAFSHKYWAYLISITIDKPYLLSTTIDKPYLLSIAIVKPLLLSLTINEPLLLLWLTWPHIWSQCSLQQSNTSTWQRLTRGSHGSRWLIHLISNMDVIRKQLRFEQNVFPSLTEQLN